MARKIESLRYRTRFAELDFQRHDKVWRIIDNSTDRPIGPQYASMQELLGDLDRFATQFGCNA